MKYDIFVNRARVFIKKKKLQVLNKQGIIITFLKNISGFNIIISVFTGISKRKGNTSKFQSYRF